MELLNDPLLVFWRALGDWGLIVVIVAVVLEVAAAACVSVLEKFGIGEHDFKKWESRLNRYEVMAGWILVIGLAMEYKGHKEETTILDSNNVALFSNARHAEESAAASYERAAVAEKDAGESKLLVARIEQTNLIFAASIEQMRSNNNVLSAKLRDTIKSEIEVEMAIAPRMMQHWSQTSESLKKYAGIGFIISIEPDPLNDDGLLLAAQIAGILEQANWKLVADDSDVAKQYFAGKKFSSNRYGVVILADVGEPDNETQAADALANELSANNIVANRAPHANGPKNLIAILVRKKPDLNAIKEFDALQEWQEHFKHFPQTSKEAGEWEKKNEELWKKISPQF